MSRQWGLARRSLVALVMAMVATSFASAVNQAAEPCHVRNPSMGTAGSSLRKMVLAANEGDRLWVRGVCVGGVVIRKDLIIKGRGAGVTVTGLDRMRVFQVRRGAQVMLRHLVISDGDGRFDGGRGGGGGVHNEGTVTIADSVVRRASVGEYPGGAIANSGTMTIRDSVVRDSRADWGGGIGNTGILTVVRTRVVANHPEGIWSRGPTTIIDSVVRDNAWGGLFVGGTDEMTLTTTRVVDNRRGGGISKSGGGTLTLQGCLVSGNSSRDGGGIETRWGELALADSMVTGNTAQRHGGGIYVVDGSTTVTLDASSSVTGNTPDDCYGTSAC